MEENNNRTAIVTGSSRGIGKSIALRLAKDGCNIVVNYRDPAKRALAEETAELCRISGVKAGVFRADVSSEKDCSALTEYTVRTFGSIDVLVNNAGIAGYGLLTRISEEEYRRIVSCDQDSVFFMTKAAAKIMKKQRNGRIINIASMAGVNGCVGGFAYSAAKGAVIAMTKAAAKELSSRSITVNAVAPGMIDTELDKVLGEQREQVIRKIGMGRYGKPEEVAAVVSYLASEDAAYTTGTVIEVHGSMES